MGPLVLFVPLIVVAAVPQLHLYDPGPTHRGLVEALRIRLGQKVTEHPALEQRALEAQIRYARKTLETEAAAAWVRTSSVGPARVVLVGEHDGRPYIETIVIDGRPGFDRDRATALKVHDLMIGPPPVQHPPVDPAPVRAEPPIPPRWRLSVEAGGLGSVGDRDAGWRGGLLAAAGPRFETRAWHLELRTGAQFVSGREAASSAGTVSLTEWGWTLLVEALARLERGFRIGPTAGARLRILQASGTTAVGTSGSETVVVPAVDLGAATRVDLMESLSLRLFVGVSANLERRQLAVNDTPLMDLGTWSGTAQISFLISAL